MNSFLLKIYAVLALMLVAWGGEVILSQDADTLDRQAQEHYEKREFTRALETWMQMLEQQPDNERVQKKIELVYEEKYKRDVAYQKARINYGKARNKVKIDFTTDDIEGAIAKFREGKREAQEALKNYFIAYRIDPNDQEIQDLRVIMKELDKDLRVAEEKIELDLAKRRRFREFIVCGRERMKKENYEGAIECWEGALGIISDDRDATEGKRRALLAIGNRLKFEKVMSLLNEGSNLFAAQKFFDARSVYKQVLNIDPGNGEAEDKLGEIVEKLRDARMLEQRMQQAEGAYVSALKNIEEHKYDNAEDDFRNILDLMDNKDYKDVKQRLAGLAGLRAAYQERLRRERIRMIETELDKGMIAYAEGRYNNAISSFEEVLRLDPKNELAQTQLSIAKDAQKIDAEEIIDDNSPYFQIVSLMAESGRQLYNRGDYHASRQKWEEILRLFPRNKIASTYMLKVTRSNKEDFFNFSKRIVDDGKDYLKLKRYKQAAEKFELVKTLNPEYPNIDQILASAREPAAGRGITGGASPEEIAQKYAMGITYYRRGGKENLARALEEFKWITARDPGNTKALINLNKIGSILRLSEGGIEEKRIRLTEEQSKLVRQYYYKGISYYSNNDFARAIQEWRKVLEIDKYHDRARNNIKKCLVLLRK